MINIIVDCSVLIANCKKKIVNFFNHQLLIANHQSAFSLIEILVVIAIMTVIISVLFPNFMGARQRARDVARKSDLSQIQKALELYKLDQNPQAYPTAGALGTGTCGMCWTAGGISGSCSTGNIYIRKYPCDPASVTTPTPYIYTANLSDNLKYDLSTCIENPVDTDRDSTPIPVCVPMSKMSYTVHEP